MLQKMRDNTQGWITKVIIGLICLVFTVWGLENLLMPGGAGERKLAKVNGEGITQKEYYQALENKKQQAVRQHIPADGSKIQKEVVESLIQHAVLTSYASRNQQAVSEEQMEQYIMTIPGFQTDGKFSNEKFMNWLRTVHMTTATLKRKISEQLLLTQQQDAITHSAFVTPSQLQLHASLEKQKRDISWSVLNYAALEKQQQVSQSKIEDYYKLHKTEFTTDEEVSVEYVHLKQDDLAKTIKVKEEDIKAAYDAYVEKESTISKPEASLIMLKIDAQHDKAAQMKQATSLKEQLDKKADFSELAKKYSTDKKTAEKGGYVGELKPGNYGKEVSDALTMLLPGEVSTPVVMPSGIVLVKRVDDGKAKVKPAREMRAQLITQLQNHQAVQVFNDTSQKLANISFESSDLREPAKTLNLTIKASSLFTEKGQKTGITANRAFTKAAFTNEVLTGNNSDLIRLSPTEAAVIHLKEHKSSREQTLAEASAKISTTLKQQQATRAIADEAEKIVNALKAGASPQKIEKDYQLSWKKIPGAASSGQKDVPGTVLKKAFELPRPGHSLSVSNVPLANKDIAVVIVNKVALGDGKLKDAEKSMQQLMLTSSLGNADYDAFTKNLRQKATVKMMMKLPAE